jgi:hypothetical protein
MKRPFTITLLTVALLVAFTTPAAASFGGDLAANLSPSQCAGTLVISVAEGVRNDIDSGTAGNFWAYDDFVRSIKVWKTGSSTYCAILGYAGTFTTVAGRSPQNTADIPAGIRGFFYGGYRTVSFTATQRATPLGSWPTQGFVGVVDYKCNATTADCPGYIDWVAQYFTDKSGPTLDLAWWGWEYRAGRHGTWVNASTGNSGDIVPVP